MGSSKKQTVGYKYYLGMHMILAHGPADAIYQIRVDDKEAWKGTNTGSQITIAAEGLFGGESREGGVSGLVDVQMGGPAQTANSYLTSQLTDVPGYRGVVGLVLRKCYLGMNPYLKRWSALLQRIYVTQDGTTQWYSITAGIPSGNIIEAVSLGPAVEVISFQDTFKYLTVITANTVDYSSPSFDDSSWASGAGIFEGSTPFPNPPNSLEAVGTTLTNLGKIWLRKTITLAVKSYVTFTVFHDDAGDVWVNGVPVTLIPSGDYWWSTTSPILVLGGTVTIVLRVTDSLPSPITSAGISATAQAVTGGDLLDMNPAHIIRECLVNPDWGMGYQTADIDDTAFTAAADDLYDEGFGLSLIWDKQIPIEDFIREILKHIEAALYVSRVTGKFVLKLIRADYDAGTLLIFDESNISKIENVTRRGFDELYNSVTLKYVNSLTNRDASVEIQDIAQVQMQGVVINTTVNYPGISNSVLAGKVCARDLRALSHPALSCIIHTNRDAKDLTIGDVFKLSWAKYDLTELVMRISGISYGNGRNNTIRIEAVEDVFSTPATSYVVVDDSGWVDPNSAPIPVTYQLAFEAPYYELVQQLGQVSTDSELAANDEAGYVGVAAARPASAINAVLSTDAGAGYTEAGVFNFCPFGLIVTNLTQNDTVVELDGEIGLDSVSVGSHAQLNDEILVVVSIVGTTFTFERGALDTVPATHTAGDRVFFWDEFFGSDPTQYNTAEVIDTKVQPVTGLGQLAIADALPVSITLNQRAFRPYPPAGYQIDGIYFPTAITDSFDITWVHRDRLQQTAGTILSFLDGSIGPEAGTTYNGYLYDNDTNALLDSTTGVSGLSWTPSVLGSYTLRAEVESVRGGLVSWQRQSAIFDFISSDGRSIDDEDFRITDDGTFRLTE